jgi:hypothetical protein
MARNIRYSALHDTTWRELVDGEHARSLTDPQLLVSLQREFHERYGLHAAGAESLGTAYDDAVQKAVDNQLPDRVARFQVELKFFQLSAWLRHASFRLLQPEGGEFIIGDSPTVVLDHDRQRFSGVWDLGLGNATHLVMPLRPDLAVQVALDGGGQFTLDTINETSVQEANELQVRTALHYVFYRPGETPAVRAPRAAAAELTGGIADFAIIGLLVCARLITRDGRGESWNRLCQSMTRGYRRGRCRAGSPVCVEGRDGVGVVNRPFAVDRGNAAVGDIGAAQVDARPVGEDRVDVGFGGGEDDVGDAGPDHGGGAHRAWLAARDHRSAGDLSGPASEAGGLDGIQLGVRPDVAGGGDAVLAFGEDGAGG